MTETPGIRAGTSHIKKKKRLPLVFFIPSLVVAPLIGVGLAAYGFWVMEQLGEPAGGDKGGPFVGIGGWFLIYAGVAGLIFIYRMWTAIQDKAVETTAPGEAIFLLIVPLLNLYGIFAVFAQYPKAFNAYVARHNLDVRPLPRKLLLWYSILLLLSVVPPVALVTVPITWIIWIIVVVYICNGVNDLLDREESHW